MAEEKEARQRQGAWHKFFITIGRCFQVACNLTVVVYWIYFSYYMISAACSFRSEFYADKYTWILDINGEYKYNKSQLLTWRVIYFCYVSAALTIVFALVSTYPIILEFLKRDGNRKHATFRTWSMVLAVILACQLSHGCVLYVHGFQQLFQWSMVISSITAISIFFNILRAYNILDLQLEPGANPNLQISASELKKHSEEPENVVEVHKIKNFRVSLTELSHGIENFRSRCRRARNFNGLKL